MTLLKMKSHTNEWNAYIGSIWANILRQTEIPKKGTLIEVAPGEVNKIGRGLENYGFNGMVYLIEPNSQAIQRIKQSYSQSLNAKIIPIQATLEQSISELPAKVDAILSNHPLDDMIIGKALSQKEFQTFFAAHYTNPVEATIKAWQSLESSPNLLKRAKEKVLQEWENLFKKTSPNIVIISQYRSYFFKKHKILSPDTNAYEVLQELKSRYKNLQ